MNNDLYNRQEVGRPDCDDQELRRLCMEPGSDIEYLGSEVMSRIVKRLFPGEEDERGVASQILNTDLVDGKGVPMCDANDRAGKVADYLAIARHREHNGAEATLLDFLVTYPGDENYDTLLGITSYTLSRYIPKTI